MAYGIQKETRMASQLLQRLPFLLLLHTLSYRTNAQSRERSVTDLWYFGGAWDAVPAPTAREDITAYEVLLFEYGTDAVSPPRVHEPDYYGYYYYDYVYDGYEAEADAFLIIDADRSDAREGDETPPRAPPLGTERAATTDDLLVVAPLLLATQDGFSSSLLLTGRSSSSLEGRTPGLCLFVSASVFVAYAWCLTRLYESKTKTTLVPVVEPLAPLEIRKS
eukprot:4820355-Prymnesium_polylepis.2